MSFSGTTSFCYGVGGGGGGGCQGEHGDIGCPGPRGAPGEPGERGVSFNMNEIYPFRTFEKNNTKTLLYDVHGLSFDDIKVKKIFINKIKRTLLEITGEYKDEYIGWETSIYTEIRIDTGIYIKYDYSVQNGVLRVTLFERINDEPEFSYFYDQDSTEGRKQ